MATSVSRRADVYSGEALASAPDLVVGWAAGYRTSWQSALGEISAEMVEVTTINGAATTASRRTSCRESCFPPGRFVCQSAAGGPHDDPARGVWSPAGTRHEGKDDFLAMFEPTVRLNETLWDKDQEVRGKPVATARPRSSSRTYSKRRRPACSTMRRPTKRSCASSKASAISNEGTGRLRRLAAAGVLSAAAVLWAFARFSDQAKIRSRQASNQGIALRDAPVYRRAPRAATSSEATDRRQHPLSRNDAASDHSDFGADASSDGRVGRRVRISSSSCG